MKLIRTTLPWPPAISRMDDWFGRALEDFGGLSRLMGLPESDETSGPARMAADIFEDDQNYFVRVEMPGARKEDVSVRLEGGVLQIAFQRQEGENEASVSLSRHFRLPGPVAVEQVAAKLEDGILTVTLPRHEAARPRAIAVE